MPPELLFTASLAMSAVAVATDLAYSSKLVLASVALVLAVWGIVEWAAETRRDDRELSE